MFKMDFLNNLNKLLIPKYFYTICDNDSNIYIEKHQNQNWITVFDSKDDCYNCIDKLELQLGQEYHIKLVAKTDIMKYIKNNKNISGIIHIDKITAETVSI